MMRDTIITSLEPATTSYSCHGVYTDRSINSLNLSRIQIYTGTTVTNCNQYHPTSGLMQILHFDWPRYQGSNSNSHRVAKFAGFFFVFFFPNEYFFNLHQLTLLLPFLSDQLGDIKTIRPFALKGHGYNIRGLISVHIFAPNGEFYNFSTQKLSILFNTQSARVYS